MRAHIRAPATVHAGLVKVEEAAVVRVTVGQPLPPYEGPVRSGVTSHGFGPYGTAYSLAGI